MRIGEVEAMVPGVGIDEINYVVSWLNQYVQDRVGLQFIRHILRPDGLSLLWRGPAIGRIRLMPARLKDRHRLIHGFGYYEVDEDLEKEDVENLKVLAAVQQLFGGKDWKKASVLIPSMQKGCSTCAFHLEYCVLENDPKECEDWKLSRRQHRSKPYPTDKE